MKREDYLREWRKLSPIIIRMTRRDGLCNHELGQIFCFRNPYDKPKGICTSLWHVVEFFAWRVELGFPSWEPDDEKVYRLHCPCETGTVWDMRKATAEEAQQHLPPLPCQPTSEPAELP
jgi:hypothetical protein